MDLLTDACVIISISLFNVPVTCASKKNALMSAVLGLHHHQVSFRVSGAQFATYYLAAQVSTSSFFFYIGAMDCRLLTATHAPIEKTAR